MAAPLGNQNGKKAKIWEQAIKRALARKAAATVDDGLDKCADRLVEAAIGGDQWALKEIGDRMDGKSAQSMTVSGDEDAPLTVRGILELVRPS